MRRRWKAKGLDLVRHAVRSLGEHLVHMPIGNQHHIPYLTEIIVGYLAVKEITHRVHEYLGRCLPLDRVPDLMRAQRHAEPVGERDATHSLRNALGVAMVAARGDLGASSNRISCMRSPAYPRVVRRSRRWWSPGQWSGARRRVPPRPARPGPATGGSPGRVDGRGPTGSYAGRCPGWRAP